MGYSFCGLTQLCCLDLLLCGSGLVMTSLTALVLSSSVFAPGSLSQFSISIWLMSRALNSYDAD
jgi:hypothetical protein